MAGRSLPQAIAAEVVSFFEWFVEAVEGDLTRSALLRDLGLDPAATTTGPPVPADRLDAVKAYRDAADPTAEQDIEALIDLATLLDAVASVVESLDSVTDAAQELGHALLELATSSYVRLRFPRLFLLLQLVSVVEELGSTYGEGSNSLVRLGSSVPSLLGFLFQPGTSLARLDATRDHPDDPLATYTDFGFRLAATIFGYFDVKRGIELVPDVFTGWDSPGLSLDAAEPAPASDVISARMTSISLGWNTHDTADDPSGAARLLISTAMVPAAEGGTALFLALGGSGDLEEPLSNRWKLSIKARADAGVAALLGAQNRVVAPTDGSFVGASIGIASQPDESSGRSFQLPAETGSRLEIGVLSAHLSLGSTGAEMLASLADSALVIEPGDSDGFVAEILGNTPLRLPFELTFGYSSTRGLVLEGSAPPVGTPAQSAPLAGPGPTGSPVIAATIPVGRAFGPVTVHEVSLRATRGPADADPKDQNLTTVEVDSSFSVRIGPVYLRVDQLGLMVTADSSKPPEQRNLRLVHLIGPGVKFPRGVAVEIDTALVTGGGSILHDPDLGIYFGTLDLCLRGGTAIKAIGLIATKQADGSKGFSFLLLLTVELATPYPLPLGFFLEGIGGMVAVHRTFDEAAMRTALPTGLLRNVLFPRDPVHHTTEVLHGLQTLFPAKHGSHLLGLLVKLGWGTPALVHFELGLIYEFGNRHRLILLGEVSAVLPRIDVRMITLNMDAVGVLDFDAGTFALDAVLHDSKLLSRFVITGGMAMRMTWHESFGLALAVGGLHPRFAAPPGFPAVARLQLALTNGENPKLICQAYFGITSNSVQFGADCSLYAAACGFAVVGDIGYDVLVQILPFHFIADYRASVQLKRGSHNLFKVSVEGELEGPLPLRIAGKATFEILWCEFSVSFDTTLVDQGDVDALIPIDALRALVDALTDVRAWQVLQPSSSTQLVTVRPPSTADGILLHPQGALTVRQTVVPLGLTRDLDRVGGAVPTGDRRFAVTAASIGPVTQTSPPAVREMFAPGQFFDLSDDDRLAAPPFESMAAGVSFGDGGYVLDASAEQVSGFGYTDIVFGADGVPVQAAQPHVPDGTVVLTLALRSAAATARTRRTLAQRFDAPVHPAAPVVNRPGWAAVDPAAPAPAVATLTWAEARNQITDPARQVLVPAYELVRTVAG